MVNIRSFSQSKKTIDYVVVRDKIIVMSVLMVPKFEIFNLFLHDKSNLGMQLRDLKKWFILKI